MKLLIRTIIVLCTVNLTAVIPASAMMVAGEDKRLTISGSTELAGARMTGLPGNIVANQRGHYSATVPYGFTGEVMPAKEGYTFEPASKRYTNMVSSRENDDYRPKPLTFTISGNADVGGAEMMGLPGNVLADQRGYYSATVPYAWSGIVRPAKSGYRFMPPTLSYPKVAENLTNQSYRAVPTSSEAEGSDLYGGAGSRSRSGRRGYAMDSDWPGDPLGSGPRGRSSGYRPTIRSGGRKALVIPSGQIRPKELAEMIEDMHVMSHILDERFKETRRVQGMFTDFGAFFGRDSRSTEATYLQGFGLLFLMEVNFAFSPPPRRRPADPNETSEAVDSTWETAKRRVFSPQGPGGMDQESTARDRDNQMVEELKKELIEALKHANNIRHIRPDEWFILTVIGGQRQFGMSFGGGLPMGGGMSGFGAASGEVAASDVREGTGGGYGGGGAMGGAYGGGGAGGGFVVGGYGDMGGSMYGGMGAMMGTGGMMGMYGGSGFSSSTVLTIRAKKADVDDFSGGQLDLEQFREKVQIYMY